MRVSQASSDGAKGVRGVSVRNHERVLPHNQRDTI